MLLFFIKRNIMISSTNNNSMYTPSNLHYFLNFPTNLSKNWNLCVSSFILLYVFTMASWSITAFNDYCGYLSVKPYCSLPKQRYPRNLKMWVDSKGSMYVFLQHIVISQASKSLLIGCLAVGRFYNLLTESAGTSPDLAPSSVLWIENAREETVHLFLLSPKHLQFKVIIV